MFENHRRGRQARNFATNVPKILDLKSAFEQIFFRKLSLGAPGASKLKQSGLTIYDHFSVSQSDLMAPATDLATVRRP